MKNRHLLNLFFIIFCVTILSCNKNTSPICNIITPLENEIIEKGSVIILSVEVNDEEDNLTSLRFFVDSVEVALLNSAPFIHNLNTSNLSIGNHSIKVVAIDEEGESDTDSIIITLIQESTGCGTITDIDGNTYSTITIGNQCWMQENLKVTKYPDGTQIPYITDSIEWKNLEDNNSDDAFCYYNNDQESEIYGALYTWSAAMGDNAISSNTNPSNTQGVCPDGWHLPSDVEWIQLTNFLDGEDVAGGKLKETGFEHWNSPNTGANNESGFSAVPSGYRFSHDGGFYKKGEYEYFWSSTEYSGTYAYFQRLGYNQVNIDNFQSNKSIGFSVRCVKDN